MPQKFSQKLIDDFKSYWLNRFEKNISTEEADQYLNSLAELFLAFDVAKNNSAVRGKPLGGFPVGLFLIGQPTSPKKQVALNIKVSVPSYKPVVRKTTRINVVNKGAGEAKV